MTPAPATGPEAEARKGIDAALEEAGWILQDRESMNVAAGTGVAVREFKLKTGHGFADYLLFVDEQAVGVVEAKPEGHTLTGVETQTQKYASGLPDVLGCPVRPLPFLYESTGAVTRFTNLLDPEPRSRPVFSFHRPDTFREWLEADPLPIWTKEWRVAEAPAAGTLGGTRPSSLRARLRTMPPVYIPGLWANKVTAITNLERSFYNDRPRALIQMATGSGKTMLAITSIYRLIKHGGARRILFLVDRKNLGEQAEKEFANYDTPDTRRKFTELYNLQRLTSNTIGSSSKVVITTIQRMFSMLKGEPDLDPEVEEGSQFDTAGQVQKEPVGVEYNAAIPPEFFDVIIIDECHRSIYSLWRQVLEYFDAYLVGLTATPAAHTFGFFNQNVVMEYSHAEAVADGCNVDFDVYRIRTQITEQGGTIEARPETVLPIRERQTRAMRWEKRDDDIVYGSADLDRRVVAPDQIRLIAKTFRDKVCQDIFPGRTEVPKTLIFAKDDSHAEDIVEIFREEFGKGNQFAQKITYKTTGAKPKDLIQDFRNSFFPRIAVTVDMIATGTDIKPVEIVMFMRTVKSKTYFEQMKGRGVRIIDDHELQAVTPDAKEKTHFVIVDCVGVCEGDLQDTQPLERKRTVSFKNLLEYVGAGSTDPDILSSLASRLARLEKQCGPEEHERIEAFAGGATLAGIAHAVVRALDADEQVEKARVTHGLANDEEPTEDQIEEAAAEMAKAATKPLRENPAFRTALVEIKRQFDQIIDEDAKDVLLGSDYSAEAKERAKNIVSSFEQYLAENKDEIEALQFFYSQPYARRLRYRDIKELATAIGAPPRQWTAPKLWHAYETLERSKVRGASSKRLLSDIVSLVRFALHQDGELIPFQYQVNERFEQWVEQQSQAGEEFTEEQMWWLLRMRDHIATNVEIGMDVFDLTPFNQRGGLGKAAQVFGGNLSKVLGELNEALVA